MTEQDKEFLDRVTSYANDVLRDIDPQKTQISAQLEKLMPVIKEIAEESGEAVEDVFIRYMDLANEAAVLSEQKLQDSLKDIPNFDGQSGSMPFFQ